MENALNTLAAQGLNVFAACRVGKLPEDIRAFMAKDGIQLNEGHTLCVLGHGGKTLWEKLPRPLNKDLHPIDSFAFDRANWLNQTVFHDPDFQILFPQSQYLLPLQRIGRFLNLGRPSLLGIDMNPQFGLWWAYRAVFVTKYPVPEKFWPQFSTACETCSEKPCQTVGPLEARANCCYQTEHRYTLEQQEYHAGRLAHLL